MILQSLDKLYHRLTDDPSYGISKTGYSVQKIGFAVVLTPEGGLFHFADLRETVPPPTGQKGKGLRKPRLLSLPGQAKPSGSGINPCFLWDNTRYLLGYDPINKDPERTARSFQAFRQHHLVLEQRLDDPAFSLVCRFLESWNPEEAVHHPLLSEMTTGFGVFQLQGEPGFVHQRPKIQAWWESQERSAGEQTNSKAGPKGMCLISGQESVPLARLHEPKIKGVRGTQGAGAPLVSFNCDVFTSYGKEQSYNAPVSEAATFRYCTALNALLDGPQKTRHRIPLANDTVVFWTEKPTLEAAFAALFAGAEEGEADGEVQDEGALQQLQVLFQALRQGSGVLATMGEDPETPFYVLGLSPNAGRASVRFWHTDTLGGFVQRLRSHFQALEIVRDPDKSREFPTVQMLLRETAMEGKYENVPPLLGGALMRAMLTGGPYPDALAAAVLRRIRADRDDKQHPNKKINYLRAAILKAWLIRSPRMQGEIPVSLDITRADPAYRLGRLFAVLEKTQEEALTGLNATIRDRYYGAVSAAPGSVIPRLLRTYQHHLGKLEHPGRKVNLEKLIQEIMSGLDTIPATLALEEQGLFALGYYHQRQDFYTRKGDSNDG